MMSYWLATKSNESQNSFIYTAEQLAKWISRSSIWFENKITTEFVRHLDECLWKWHWLHLCSNCELYNQMCLCLFRSNIDLSRPCNLFYPWIRSFFVFFSPFSFVVRFVLDVDTSLSLSLLLALQIGIFVVWMTNNKEMHVKNNNLRQADVQHIDRFCLFLFLLLVNSRHAENRQERAAIIRFLMVITNTTIVYCIAHGDNPREMHSLSSIVYYSSFLVNVSRVNIVSRWVVYDKWITEEKEYE